MSFHTSPMPFCGPDSVRSKAARVRGESPRAAAALFLFCAALLIGGCGVTTNGSGATQAATPSPTKTTPTITWATPAAITYGTALSSTQLNASTSVPGTLVYTPAAGTIPAVGTVSLTVNFTPTDTVHYNSASASVNLVVDPVSSGPVRKTPHIKWATPADITYGTPLTSAQLDATADVEGTFTYSPQAGTVLPAGTSTLTAVFTPSDTNNFNKASAKVKLNVKPKSKSQSAPTITWPAPAAITYGTALSSTQLDATASVPGTFVYSPGAGTIPPVGTDTLSVTFTPSNTNAYSTVTASVQLDVNSAATTTPTTPTITWPTPAAITYGTALSSTQLDATASVPGTFVYSPAAGSVPAVGTDTLSVTFTPTDTTAYTTATASVQLVVNSATTTTTPTTPTITWPTPAAITYGTALSSTQLDATASVPGTFVYSPAAGTIPPVGTDTLSVTFTPTDTTAYTTATASVPLVVSSVTKTTPTITWPTPAAITYGTALSSTQLDATASVPGTFVYSPAAGTIPPVGTDTLSVTFTPTDTTAYTTATASVALVVNSSSSGSPTGTALNSCGDLTTSGTYYLSQDVRSSGTCFFIDANNITLNLNGHTITYGTGGGSQGTPGILLADTWYTAPGYTLAQTGSTDNHDGFVLYGGTITEAANAAPQSRGIWVGQSNNISPAPVIHDVVINTYTEDAEPIFGSVSTSGWQIYNNTLNWACKSTFPASGTVCDSSRYSLYGYALWIADDPNAPGTVPDQIYNNKIIAAPQGGVFDNHQNAQIHDNDITFDAYFSNDYCVATVSGNGQVINHNNCHPTSGRGIDVEAANVQVTNNTISVQELPQNSEYGGCELAGTDGIRVRDNAYQGNPAAPTGVTVSGNTISVSGAQCQANGLRLTNLTSGDSVTVANNTIASSGTSPNTDDAISFDGDDQAQLTFTGNTLQSQYTFVQVDWDGANQSVGSGQTWNGTPQYFVDNENGFNDPGGTGPTFSQSLTIDMNGSGTVHCGASAAGPVVVGTTSVVCN